MPAAREAERCGGEPWADGEGTGVGIREGEVRLRGEGLLDKGSLSRKDAVCYEPARSCCRSRCVSLCGVGRGSSALGDLRRGDAERGRF